MADDNWTTMPFTEAVLVNPSIRLTRGTTYSFVEMAAVNPSTRSVHESEIREFKGGGARFISGDTLMARITPCLENGKIARFWPTDGTSPGFGSTEFIVIRGRDGVTDNDFAYYLTQWPEFRHFAISQMTGSSGRQRVPASSLAHFEVTIPPIPVQRRIARILGTLDDKIELNRKMNQTLEAIAQVIFKSWFVDFDPVIDNALAAGKPIPEEFAERAARRARLTHGKSPLPENIRRLFPDEFQDSELGPIPKGWEVHQIGKVVKVVGGSTPSTKSPAFWEGGTHCWTTPKDLSAATSPVLLDTARKITDAGLAKISSGLLPINTFLLSSRAPVGYTAIAKVPLAVNQGYIAIPPGGRLSSLFLLYWTRANLDQIRAQAGGTTFQEISKRNFRPIQVVVPPTEVVAEFDDTVGQILDLIELNDRESRTLIAIRDVLLPKLISGEIRVREPQRLFQKSLMHEEVNQCSE